LLYPCHFATIIGALVWLWPLTTESAADIEAGRQKAEVCVPCHGKHGNSTDPAIPALAAQPPLYTYYQLLMFRDEQRIAPQMLPVVKTLSHTDMQNLAAYYATQTPVASSHTGDPEKLEAGQNLVQTYYCNNCHRPDLMGQNHIPRLAGQHEPYLAKQLQAYKAQTRKDMDGTMTTAAQALSHDEIEALAHFMAQLSPIP
jgi:cytochrome c553